MTKKENKMCDRFCAKLHFYKTCFHLGSTTNICWNARILILCYVLCNTAGRIRIASGLNRERDEVYRIRIRAQDHGVPALRYL